MEKTAVSNSNTKADDLQEAAQVRSAVADALTALEANLCEHSEDPDATKRRLADALKGVASATQIGESVSAPQIIPVEDFAAVEEAGASALLGSEENALIAEDSDALVTGDGGAGKTTLTTDLACHLAGGDAWLDIPVPRPVRVLLIENEGPRPLFRKKLARKVQTWAGSALEGRLSVFEHPWGAFTFANPAWRAALATAVAKQEIDVLIAGPVTRLGMEEAGTLQQVRDFMKLVDDVRAKAGRPLAVILVHHDNKAGNVSGAWEGAGDTLLHVEARGPGYTALEIQKARWSSEHHGQKLKLAWVPGDAFSVSDARDYVAEIEALLGDGTPRTVKDIMRKRDSDRPGIGAGEDTVKSTLKDAGHVFRSIPGETLGKSPKATYYALHLA